MDLHSHSIFAGGTQSIKISPERTKLNHKKALSHLMKINETMPLKGIDLVGTGDCQFKIWMEILRESLIEDKLGIYYLESVQSVKFILQTEIIFTAPIGKRSKIVHVVFLFPSFSNVETFRHLLDEWKVKHEKMARPFVKCTSPEQVSERIFKILDINNWIEAIPAHIMTPQGVFGSNIRINHLTDFFGPVSSRLQIFETGLSADPEFLALIPELDNRTLISCSDAHSSALHRMGREFTVVSIPKIDYKSIINALRKNNVSLTAEFPPEEGRFFLTGHRSGRKSPGIHEDNEYCYFSPQHVPSSDICPICQKTLTIGVYQRCVEISKAQGVERKLGNFQPKKKFIRMVPLIDIIAHVLNIKTKTSKSVIENYHQVIAQTGPERNLWQYSSNEVDSRLMDKIDSSIRKAILQVKAENFTFQPYGFDGVYGSLIIGQKGNYKKVKVIKTSKPIQKTL
jgi:PHP family Zn ribbon phosphoesterase